MGNMPLIDVLQDLLRFRPGRPAAAAGTLFLAALALSLSMILLVGGRDVRRVFLFPSDSHKESTVHAEVRPVPQAHALEANVLRYVEEGLLGPSFQESVRLFPRDTRVETAILQGRSLYLNLSADVFSPREATMLPPQEAMDLLKEAITMNFPRIQEVFFFVNGQTPRFP